MPSNTTHFIFSEDVYHKLDEKSKNRISKSKDIYNLFSQSHDLLFYYYLDLKQGRRIRHLGTYAHHNKTQYYLINIIKEIKINRLENDPDIMAFLYGVITHYVLDTHCHPYIFYKTGVYRKKQKWTHKYYGEHTHIEKELDSIYYTKKYNKPYNKCNLNKEIIKDIKIDNKLENFISSIYRKSYGVPDVGSYINKSIRIQRIVNTLAVHDRFGIKKFLFYILRFLTFNKLKKLPYYSSFNFKPINHWLNEEHKEWNHPCFKDKKFKDSFDDIYKKSIKDTIKIINAINKVLYEKELINTLNDIIPNIDYATGIPCNDPNMMNYFEY